MATVGPFRKYLEHSKERAANTLLEKAYLANRIAKISGGDQREKLYRLKSRYLSAAIRLVPEMFLVDSRIVLDGKKRLLGITTNVGFRFHVLIKENTQETGTVSEGRRRHTEIAA